MKYNKFFFSHWEQTFVCRWEVVPTKLWKYKPTLDFVSPNRTSIFGRYYLYFWWNTKSISDQIQKVFLVQLKTNFCMYLGSSYHITLKIQINFAFWKIPHNFYFWKILFEFLMKYKKYFWSNWEQIFANWRQLVVLWNTKSISSPIEDRLLYFIGK